MTALECFHCELPGHWADSCPLLVPPAGQAEHEARFEAVMARFFDGRITPAGKRRVIETENRMWKAIQKETEKAK